MLKPNLFWVSVWGYGVNDVAIVNDDNDHGIWGYEGYVNNVKDYTDDEDYIVTVTCFGDTVSNNSKHTD